MLDTARILSDHEGREILDGTDHCAGFPLESGLTPAIEARLVGQHLYENPVAVNCVHDLRFNACDFHPGVLSELGIRGSKVLLVTIWTVLGRRSTASLL